MKMRMLLRVLGLLVRKREIYKVPPSADHRRGSASVDRALKSGSNPPAGAPRPRDCELDCSGLEAIGLGQRTPFRKALESALPSSDLQ
jgi:hypothetical protein